MYDTVNSQQCCKGLQQVKIPVYYTQPTYILYCTAEGNYLTSTSIVQTTLFCRVYNSVKNALFSPKCQLVLSDDHHCLSAAMLKAHHSSICSPYLNIRTQKDIEQGVGSSITKHSRNIILKKVSLVSQFSVLQNFTALYSRARNRVCTRKYQTGFHKLPRSVLYAK